MYELTVDNLKAAFFASLFDDHDPRLEELMKIQQSDGPMPDYCVVVKSVLMEAGFCREKLEAQRRNVADLLNQLPEQFHNGTGNGWSFLNACMHRDGTQWGEQMHVDHLLAIGLALGMVRFQMPRNMWKVLPGGMPYFVVNTLGFPPEATQPDMANFLAGIQATGS